MIFPSVSQLINSRTGLIRFVFHGRVSGLGNQFLGFGGLALDLGCRWFYFCYLVSIYLDLGYMGVFGFDSSQNLRYLKSR